MRLETSVLAENVRAPRGHQQRRTFLQPQWPRALRLPGPLQGPPSGSARSIAPDHPQSLGHCKPESHWGNEQIHIF